ncbi:MAG: metalloregulator ArsR/SmtB family transcription factor [Terriglobia bacterium]|nr:metalloregulator ArsR/SmtB family transcription factor [Terriglobia bacterium]
MKRSNGRKPFAIDDRIFERQAVICKAFAHPKRLKLLSLLSDGERPMSELQKELSLSRANMSQHVAILRAAGVIDTYRNGQHMYCFLAFPEVKKACHLIHEVLRSQIRDQKKFAI